MSWQGSSAQLNCGKQKLSKFHRSGMLNGCCPTVLTCLCLFLPPWGVGVPLQSIAQQHCNIPIRDPPPKKKKHWISLITYLKAHLEHLSSIIFLSTDGWYGLSKSYVGSTVTFFLKKDLLMKQLSDFLSSAQRKWNLNIAETLRNFTMVPTTERKRRETDLWFCSACLVIGYTERAGMSVSVAEVWGKIKLYHPVISPFLYGNHLG